MKIVWGFFCALFLAAAWSGGKGAEAREDVTVCRGGLSLESGVARVMAEEPGAVRVMAGESGVVRASLEETGVLEAPPAETDEADPAADISLYAASAVLMDGDSGRVLYGKNADAPMPMASTTKIMTCILVLENTDPDETLTVSSYAAGMPKVKLYLKKGEEYTVRDLLYSLMLESHNDSAVALAEHVGKRFLEGELANKPSDQFTLEESGQAVAAFARLMNEKAVELGCRDSWFITPNGLDATQEFFLPDGTAIQKEHCTTAAELAGIMSYCIGKSPQRESFLEITGTPSHSFYANGRSFTCTNHNAFLNMMDGALSGKTGFTNKAGYCYVGALERDGRTFVVALLACGWPNNKSYKWSDTRELMQYGIDNYFYRSFSEEGTAFDSGQLKDIPVLNGQTEVLGGTVQVGVEVAVPEAGGKAEKMKEASAAGDKPEETGEDTAEINRPEEAGKDTAEINRPEETGKDAAETKGPEKNLEGLLLREDEKIRVEYTIKDMLTAPVEKGEKVGEITYVVGDTVYRRESIVTVSAVREIDIRWCLEQVLARFFVLKPGEES